VDQDQLSSEGSKLIQDCREIIETARLIVQEKNSDELFQNFLWNTSGVDSNVKKDPNEVLPVEKSKAQEDRHQGMCRFSLSPTLLPISTTAARHLRTLGNIIATNSEVRKILSDFSVIGRDILARTASHAAGRVRPEQDILTKVDRPAAPDQFEAAGSSQAGAKGTSGVEHEGQARSAAQDADDSQERVHEERNRAQHSEVTEVKVEKEYVLVFRFSP